MGGKTTSSSSTVSVPPEVLARYNSVNSIAQSAAGIKQTPQLNSDGTPVTDSAGNPTYDYSMSPYQGYTGEFVAPVNQQESQSIQNINTDQFAAQPGISAGQAEVNQGLLAGESNTSSSLDTMSQATNQGNDLYAQSLGTVANGAQQSQGLYNQSLGSIGSAAGQAANQYGTLYGSINSAQDVGNNYAGLAGQYIQNSGAASQPLMQGDTALTGQGLQTGAQYAQQAQGYLNSGTQSVNAQQFGQNAVNQYMSPYMSDVVQSQQALMNQQNAQQQSALKGNAISSGAFGGDRAGIAQANLAQQQGLANQATMSNLLQQGYGQALGAFQQQQGVNLQAGQANRAAQQFGEQASAALGQQQYGQNLGAAQNFGNIGNTLYSQQMGQGQAMAGLGQQQYAQGLGAAQAQAGLIGQNYQMGAQQAGMQQSAAQGLFNQNAQQAGLQQQAAQGIFGQQAQNAAFQQQAGQSLFNMNQQAGMNTANLGLQSQQALLQGNQAALQGGQLMQQTQQAQDQAQYNQFLQQQGYPFQVAQYLANIAEGTGALSGSTTNSTGTAPFFSDRRLKKDIKKLGKTDDGLPIYKFKYKGDPSEQTHIGFMADEVEKKHPEAVGESQGFKTVDYDAATKDSAGGRIGLGSAGEGYAGGGLVSSDELQAIMAAGKNPFSGYGQNLSGPGASMKGAGLGSAGYVPAPNLAVPKLVTATPPSTSQKSGLQSAIGDVNQLKGLYDTAKSAKGMGSDALDYLKGLGAATGGAIHGYADGGSVDDTEPYGNAPEHEGYMAGVLKHMDAPHALMTAQNPTGSKSGGSGLSDITGAIGAAKSVMGIGSDIMEGLGSLFLLKDGGSVPYREHHDGSEGNVVGDQTPPDAQTVDPAIVDNSDNPQGLAPASFNPREILTNAAKSAGLAPEHLIRLSQAETGLKSQFGDENSSGGLLQMHVGHVSKKYPNPGLGDEFFHSVKPELDNKLSPQEKVAYLNDEKNQQEVSNFAAAHAAKNGFGAWSTARGLGLLGDVPSKGASVATGTPPAGLAAAMQTDDTPKTGLGAADTSEHKGSLGSISDAASSMGDWFDRNQKWLIPLMSGLGTMAGSNSRYLGAAILQGIGGAGSAYANLQKQQAEIMKDTLGIMKDRFTPVPQKDGSIMYYDKYGARLLTPDQYRTAAYSIVPANIRDRIFTNSSSAQGNTSAPPLTGGTSPTQATSTPAKNAPNQVASQPPAPQQMPSTAPATQQPPQTATQAPSQPSLQDAFKNADDAYNPFILAQEADAYRRQAEGATTIGDTTQATRFDQLSKDRQKLASDILSGDQQVLDKNGQPMLIPQIQDIKRNAEMDEKWAGEKVGMKKEYMDNATKYIGGYGNEISSVDAAIKLYQKIDTSGGTDKMANAISAANLIGRTIGVNITSPEMQAFQAAYAQGDKNATGEALNKVLQGLQRAPGAAISATLKTVADPTMPPSAKFEILTKARAEIQHDYDKYHDWLSGGTKLLPVENEDKWAKGNLSTSKYWEKTAASTQPFAGMNTTTSKIVTYQPAQNPDAGPTDKTSAPTPLPDRTKYTDEQLVQKAQAEIAKDPARKDAILQRLRQLVPSYGVQ